MGTAGRISVRPQEYATAREHGQRGGRRDGGGTGHGTDRGALGTYQGLRSFLTLDYHDATIHGRRVAAGPAEQEHAAIPADRPRERGGRVLVDCNWDSNRARFTLATHYLE